MNKTQKNQPVYKNIEPRCPGAKGKRGCTDCSGSNTNVGCQTCWGCTYTFDVSSNAFTAAYPSYGDFANVNLLVDNSNNPPCEWQYNAIVEGFSFHINDPSSASVSINIEDNKCVGVQDICGVYFYPPVGGATGVYVGQFKNCNNITEEIPGHEMTVPIPNRFATTAKRMGAPYRNPIAGWRKTLDCCQEPCIMLLQRAGVGTISIIPGVTQWQQNDCTGTIIDYTYSQGVAQDVTSITVELDNCCCPANVGPSTVTTTDDFIVSNASFIPSFQRGTSTAAQQPTNTVYKDNYSGGKNTDPSGIGLCGTCPVDCNNNIAPRSGNAARTHRPIIRSGMQEKKPCCRDSKGKCNKTNDYSFSYWQYKHNKRCLDYERNQEKYVRNFPACGIFHGRMQCLNAYRKSSCCDCGCEPCFQILDNNQGDITNISVGATATQFATGASGTVTEVTYTVNGIINLVTIQNDDCDSLFKTYAQGDGIAVSGEGVEWVDFTISATSAGGIAENCSNKAMAKTIYKPSNKKFSHQGAVTSGGRLERLKLDTIKSANSRCTKNAPRKCIEIQSKFVGLNKTYKYPNGKYGAGKPRFTGWMFNGHHREVKSRVYNMVRYNQQPLGIPQLTAHPPGKTCIKQCFPRTLNLGSNRPTAAGNRARIPGSKCVTKSPCDCLPAEDNNLTVGFLQAGGPPTYDFYGSDSAGTGSFDPSGIAPGFTVKWIGYQIRDPSSTLFDNRFYVALDQSGATQTLFNNITFVDCTEPSVKTYYTSDAQFEPATGSGYSAWFWPSSQPASLPNPSEVAYWSSKNGRTLKVYFDNVPQLCSECNCSCTNLQYQTGQGVPCC